MPRSRLHQLAPALLVAVASLAAPARGHASDFWKPFLGGAASAFALHEGSHLALDVALDARPRLKRVNFGPLPFFAITHRSGLPAGREALISGAGFLSQHLGSEAILSTRPAGVALSPFEKGMLAFHAGTSLAYAGAAFSRYGPYERDTRGIAEATGSDERLIGALVLAPAAFDTWRALRPESRTARWGSRLSKAVFLGVIAFKR